MLKSESKYYMFFLFPPKQIFRQLNFVEVHPYATMLSQTKRIHNSHQGFEHDKYNTYCYY